MEGRQNEKSVFADYTVDSFLATYGSGNSFVDSDGYIYWLTSGKTASSSSTTGFCTVGICVTYNSYTIEFVEPCVANKRIWYANGTPMYITVVEEKVIDGTTYDLLRIKKQDIIDAFLTKYADVDFMGSLISSSNVRLNIDSIMTTWKKNGNYKKGQLYAALIIGMFSGNMLFFLRISAFPMLYIICTPQRHFRSLPHRACLPASARCPRACAPRRRLSCP